LQRVVLFSLALLLRFLSEVCHHSNARRGLWHYNKVCTCVTIHPTNAQSLLWVHRCGGRETHVSENVLSSRAFLTRFAMWLRRRALWLAMMLVKRLPTVPRRLIGLQKTELVCRSFGSAPALSPERPERTESKDRIKMRRVSSVWQLGRLRAFAKASNRSEVITKAAPLARTRSAANRPAEWALADGVSMKSACMYHDRIHMHNSRLHGAGRGILVQLVQLPQITWRSTTSAPNDSQQHAARTYGRNPGRQNGQGFHLLVYGVA